MAKLLHSTASPHRDGPRLERSRDLPMSISGEYTVAVAGDIVMTRPISSLQDDGIQAALEPIRSSDLAVANLEQTIADRHRFRGSPYGVAAFQIMADPAVAQDLANIGFDVLARANNRLSDFGPEGNRETDAHLRAAGVTPVGYGEHLAEARAPVYRDTPRGRVGTVSVTTHVNHALDGAFAASARIGLSNGRPGANSLRVTRTIALPKHAWNTLKDFVTTQDYAFPGAFVVVPSVMVYEDRFKIGDNWYVPAERAGYRYEANSDDLREILRSVTNAAFYSDFTICAVHGHQWSIDSDDPRGGLAGETGTPPDFLIRLAHDAIKAGADLFCNTGPFDFRGIEIIDGKPAFYGLGSFVRQAYMEEVLPWEAYRPHQFGPAQFPGVNPHDSETTDAEIVYARAPRHPGSYFEGATAQCLYHAGRVRRIEISPVDMGINGPASHLGTPRRAVGEQARRILEEIARRCGAFGTKMKIEDGTGVIEVA